MKVRRWITMHGFAVNVDQRALHNFENIVPCGIEGRDVTCINDYLDIPISMERFVSYVKTAIELVFVIKLLDQEDGQDSNLHMIGRGHI